MILGPASGTRQTGVFDPASLPRDIHGACFSGGSAFGLRAADGVMAFLESRGMGFDSGHGYVPIVPTAILFDLAIAQTRPNADAGWAAAAAANQNIVPHGRVGAGTGATVAKWTGKRLPGGVGTCAADLEEWTVGALAVVNAVGAVKDPDTGTWIAGRTEPGIDSLNTSGDWEANTTLVAVVVNAPLDRNQATILARMASAGIARTIFPAFTPFDGDVVFAFSTCKAPPVSSNCLARLGELAARLVAQSIVQAVKTAPFD